MRKIRIRAKDAGDLDPGCLDGCGAVDGLEVLAVIVVVVVVALLMVFFVVPFLVALVDVLILLVLATIALVVRVVFRRPAFRLRRPAPERLGELGRTYRDIRQSQVVLSTC